MSAGTPAGGRPPRRKEEITCGDGRTLLWTCGCLVVAGDLLPGHAPADHRLRSPGRGLVPSPFPSTTRRRARGSKPGWITTLDWRNSTRRPSPSPGPQQGASRAGEPVVMGLHVAAVRGVHGMDVVFFSGRSRVRFGLALGLSGLGGSALPRTQPSFSFQYQPSTTPTASPPCVDRTQRRHGSLRTGFLPSSSRRDDAAGAWDTCLASYTCGRQDTWNSST